MSGYLTYACDLPGGHVSVAFPNQGDGCAVVSGNLDRQEIGFYRFPLPADAVARLRALLHNSNYRDIPPPPPMEPDTPTLAVGEATPNDELPELRSFLLRDLPAAIVPYVDLSRATLDVVRQGPARVVAGEAQLLHQRVNTGDPVELEVTLRSVGSDPLITDNPLREEAHDMLGVDLIVERMDKPSHQLDDEVVRVGLEPRHIAALPGGTQDTGPRLSLGPGQGVYFHIARRFWMSPGRYRAAIVYTTTNNTDDPIALDGALAMNAGQFQVVSQ